MNCQYVRTAIDTATRRETHGTAVEAHLNGCPDCRIYGDQTKALLALLGNQPVVQAPADFDFRLRARIARAESKPQTIWTTWAVVEGLWERFWARSFSLGQALTLTATLALVATFTAVQFIGDKEPGSPSQASHESREVANQSQRADLPKLTVGENISPASRAPAAKAAPRYNGRNIAPSSTSDSTSDSTTESPASGPYAGEVARKAAASNTASNEDTWRAYHPGKGQIIATPNRPTLIGAENSASTMMKTAAFVPSI